MTPSNMRVHSPEWQATERELEELRFKLFQGSIKRSEYTPRARALLDQQDELINAGKVWRD